MMMQLPMTGEIIDHGQQRIAYRLHYNNSIDAVDAPWECSLDPHGVDQWTVFGSAKTTGKAVSEARKAWNEYDSQP